MNNLWITAERVMAKGRQPRVQRLRSPKGFTKVVTGYGALTQPTRFLTVGTSSLQLHQLRSYVSFVFGFRRDALDVVKSVYELVLGNAIIARSPGASARVLPKLVRLPSGQPLTPHITGVIGYRIGRAPVLDYASGKSSNFFFKKAKLSVRGTAKNACDHRNGGKGAGGLRKFI